MFASSFTVGAVVVNFGALVMQHEDKGGALRELTLNCHWASEADWNNFRQQINWNIEMIPMPWGTTVEVLIKGGPGAGTLVVPGLTPNSYTAWLTECSRTWYNGITGHSTGKSHFILQAN